MVSGAGYGKVCAVCASFQDATVLDISNGLHNLSISCISARTIMHNPRLLYLDHVLNSRTPNVAPKYETHILVPA